jgi:hypothetical protein
LVAGSQTHKPKSATTEDTEVNVAFIAKARRLEGSKTFKGSCPLDSGD